MTVYLPLLPLASLGFLSGRCSVASSSTGRPQTLTVSSQAPEHLPVPMYPSSTGMGPRHWLPKLFQLKESFFFYVSRLGRGSETHQSSSPPFNMDILKFKQGPASFL